MFNLQSDILVIDQANQDYNRTPTRIQPIIVPSVIHNELLAKGVSSGDIIRIADRVYDYNAYINESNWTTIPELKVLDQGTIERLKLAMIFNEFDRQDFEEQLMFTDQMKSHLISIDERGSMGYINIVFMNSIYFCYLALSFNHPELKQKSIGVIVETIESLVIGRQMQEYVYLHDLHDKGWLCRYIDAIV